MSMHASQLGMDSQVFDVLALLNFMKLLTLPAVESTEQQDSNES